MESIALHLLLQVEFSLRKEDGGFSLRIDQGSTLWGGMVQQRWAYPTGTLEDLHRAFLLMASSENSTKLYESLGNTHLELERREPGMESITSKWGLSLVKYVSAEVMAIDRIQYKKHYATNVRMYSGKGGNYNVFFFTFLQMDLDHDPDLELAVEVSAIRIGMLISSGTKLES